jgi:hypothetical protein
MKNYHAFATPAHSQTNETLSCYVSAKTIKEAKEIFAKEFRNVEKVRKAK